MTQHASENQTKDSRTFYTRVAASSKSFQCSNRLRQAYVQTTGKRKARKDEALANAAKHLAFTRCGELNLNEMVDAQAMIEGELLMSDAIVS